MNNLMITHLRFDCQAETPIIFPKYLAGNAIRNGLADVMLKATCPTPSRSSDPVHVAQCPACYLLSARTDAGTVVRGYTLIPPLPLPTRIQPKHTFAFGLTLFGETMHQYLPYFVLAIRALGQSGVGVGRQNGNGRFHLNRITSHNPFTQQKEVLWAAGEETVYYPTQTVSANAIPPSAPTQKTVTLQFLSLMGLKEKGVHFQQPDFAVFFQRLLYRIDELNRQYAGAERRGRDEVTHLSQVADKVRLVASDITYHHLWSRSKRKKTLTPLSGFVGQATYYAEDWSALWPFLLWGQSTQAGKATAKGNGVYAIKGLCHWDWLSDGAVYKLSGGMVQ